MSRAIRFSLTVVAFISCVAAAQAKASEAQGAVPEQVRGAYRFEKGGWIYVHLEGSPEQIGYQHG